MTAEDTSCLLGDFIPIVDSKLHMVTRNIMVVPLKLGRNVVGCLEVANKRGTQEFTDNDQDLLKMVSEKVAAGLISFEMRQQSLKKEIDDENKYLKGHLNESYNQFLAPILADVQILLMKTLKAEK